MIDYEQKISEFFDSVIAVLDNNAKSGNDEKQSAEINGNIERVRKIAKVPHLMTNFQTRWRLNLNPTKTGFMHGKTDVYPEFIEVLNAVHMFYNSDLPNKNEILNKKLVRWNMVVSGNKVSKFATILKNPRMLFVRTR